jgi:Zn-finger nucleic acid-binding protein
MDCPSCDKQPLRPAKLDDRLPGYACSQCGGFLLDILTYRSWMESEPAEPGRGDSVPEADTAGDSKGAILCPKCGRMMSKYRIAGDVENRLDLCNYCGGLWFDGGEWELLKRLDLASKVPQILSQPWQKQVRAQSLRQSVEKRFAALFGPDYEKIHEFRRWMRKHANAAQIKAYINRSD